MACGDDDDGAAGGAGAGASGQQGGAGAGVGGGGFGGAGGAGGAGSAGEGGQGGSSNLKVVEIVAGESMNCAVLDDASLRCWGYNEFGQLGYGHTKTIGDDETPASAGPVPIGGPAVQVRGGFSPCAILEDGTVRCWGYNEIGQLGYGITGHIGDAPGETASTAGPLSLGGKAVHIAIGDGVGHACAILEDGAVRCWGYNGYGQLGYGHTDNVGDGEVPSSQPALDLGGKATGLALGNEHSCALLEGGTVRCWGRNNYGQLGLGHTDNVGDDGPPSASPPIDLGGKAVQIAAGGNHACAILEDGTVRCWGQNLTGRLGYGNGEDVGDDEAPASAGAVDLGGKARQISTSAEHSCALLEGGTVRCWGRNNYGQLGLGHDKSIGDDETPASQPVVDVGGAVRQISVGFQLVCALLESGAVRCWGRGDHLGRAERFTIGDNEAPATASPVQIF